MCRPGRGLYQAKTFVLTAPVADLKAGRAQEILGRVAVAAYYAEHNSAYCRVRFEGNGKDVAFWDDEARSGVVMVDDHDQDLDWIEPPWPAWAAKVEELESALTEPETATA